MIAIIKTEKSAVSIESFFIIYKAIKSCDEADLKLLLLSNFKTLYGRINNIFLIKKAFFVILVSKPIYTS